MKKIVVGAKYKTASKPGAIFVVEDVDITVWVGYRLRRVGVLYREVETGRRSVRVRDEFLRSFEETK